MPKGKNQKNIPPFLKFNVYWIYGVIFLVLIALYFTGEGSLSKDMNWTELQSLAQKNDLEKVVVYNKRNIVEAFLKDSAAREIFPDAKAPLKGAKVIVQIPSADYFSTEFSKWQQEYHLDAVVSYNDGGDMLWDFFLSVAPFALLIFVWIFLMRRMSGQGGGGGVFNVGKARAQIFDQTNRVNVNFNDVAGLSEENLEVE